MRDAAEQDIANNWSLFSRRKERRDSKSQYLREKTLAAAEENAFSISLRCAKKRELTGKWGFPIYWYLSLDD